MEVAAIDCTIEKTICSLYEVSGFPTFKYFKYYDKEPVKAYEGGRTSTELIQFLEDPDNPMSGHPPPAPSAEEQWAIHEGAQFVQHLTDSNFDDKLATFQHAIVMFYAPW